MTYLISTIDPEGLERGVRGGLLGAAKRGSGSGGYGPLHGDDLRVQGSVIGDLVV